MGDVPSDPSVAGQPQTAPAPVHSGRRSALRALTTALVLAGVAIALVAFRTHGNRGGTTVGALDSRSPALNQPAPNFALSDPGGHLVRLSDLRGKVVLVNFWATWCVPCRQELPAIEQVYREQQNQGFAVLEVDEQDPPAQVDAFTAQVGAMPPVLLDKDGSVMVQYHLKGLPDSFILDRQGIVRAVSYGPLSSQSIVKYIDGARAAPAP